MKIHNSTTEVETALFHELIITLRRRKKKWVKANGCKKLNKKCPNPK